MVHRETPSHGSCCFCLRRRLLRPVPIATAYGAGMLTLCLTCRVSWRDGREYELLTNWLHDPRPAIREHGRHWQNELVRQQSELPPPHPRHAVPRGDT